VKTSVQAIRGMNDILPDEARYWARVESIVREVFGSYGYQEIRFPIVENTALFKRGIGEVTDIVEKEMYTFDDRNGDSLTLRPEGTAVCVRACLEHGLLYGETPRLWYHGPMFRHERPQKGRYRQFHQFGVEVFGIDGPDIDAEIIAMSARLWDRLGLRHDMTLELNTLGTSEERARYHEQLVEYFSAHSDQLDEDSQRRLLTNPLRILDSKNPEMQKLIESAPKLIDTLGEDSKQHFLKLRDILDALKISYVINPRLVRGLDYYGKTVFEWTTQRLGAQGTVCAGGRYDGLVETLGGNPTSGVGFALGLERLILLYQEMNPVLPSSIHVYCLTMGEPAEQLAWQLLHSWRETLSWLNIVMHCGGGSFKSQFKKADKSGAAIALVIGDNEVQDGTVGVKFLREDIPQETIVLTDMVNFLRNYFEHVD